MPRPEEGLSPFFACNQRPTLVDFPGRLAAVFFVAGCNFACGFCHNRDLLGAPRPGLPWARVEEICAAFARDWVDAAVITGGEPTLAPDLPAAISFFRRRGWVVKLDTNGSNPAVLRGLLPDVDYVALDIKTAPEDYPALTGCADAAAVRESVALIMANARDYEFRTTLIEAVHTEESIRRMGEMVRGARRHVLQPFVPHPNLPDERFRSMPRTSVDFMERMALVLREYVPVVSLRGVGT